MQWQLRIAPLVLSPEPPKTEMSMSPIQDSVKFAVSQELIANLARPFKWSCEINFLRGSGKAITTSPGGVGGHVGQFVQEVSWWYSLSWPSYVDERSLQLPALW